MPTPEKYGHIDFKPPQGARKEAEKSLAWRREFGRGGTAVGIARARDLANGVELSPSTVRRMKAFFDRHQKNRSAPGWSPDEDGFPSNSRIAWAMWGSDAGWSWAKKVVEQMNAADEKEKNERGLRPYGSTHGMRPKVYVVHGAPCSGKKDYVAKHLGEKDVVFDYDAVMSAISGRPAYQPSSSLVSYCLDIRTLILKKAMQKSGADKTWVIMTKVSDDMKSQLSDVPVQYVHIDTPKEECLQRLEQDEQRQPVAEELRKVIEDYFSEGTEEQRRAPLTQPGVERRFLGNFSSAERLDPELLRVEKRSDPETGKPQTYIVGYAARFYRDSLLLGDFVEQIDPGAFEIVKNRQDEDGKPLETRCLFNHDPNYLLGRFPTTMRMTVDDKGLKYECLLPEAHAGIGESISRGDLKGSSFSFVVAEGGERWTTENGQSRRIVTKVKAILDCGPVTYPAYSDASVAVAKRSYEGFVGEVKKPIVEKRKRRLDSLARRAEVLRKRIAAEHFLAERRDCGREDDGRFAEGNTCGGASESAGSGKGLAKAYKKTGSSLKSVDRGAKALGLNVEVKEVDGRVIARSDGATAFEVSKGKEGTDVSFYSTGDPTEAQLIDETQGGALTKLVENERDPEKFRAGVEKLSGKLADDYERSAREMGASTVSASLFDAESVAAFKSRGFAVSEEPAGKWAPTVVTKKLSGPGNPNVALAKKAMDDWEAKRKGHRSISSVSRRDCGRDDSGRFGSGNSCQDDGDGAGDGKSGSQDGVAGKLAKGTGEQAPPAGQSDPNYMELKRPITPSKVKAAQKFADSARKRQEAKTKEKSTSAKDDGSGVQTWSKGDSYPWTTKQVGDSEKGGYVQGTHPDGTKTKKYEFPAGGDAKDAYRQAEEEIKQQKKKRGERSLREIQQELRSFLRSRK